MTYVESLGLRRPSPTRSDTGRIIARVRSTTTHEAPAPPRNVSLVTPRVIPYHRRNSTTWPFNVRSLHKQLAAWMATPYEQRLLWTFSPVTYELEQHAAATVYHCVDLLAEFPRVDARAVRDGETNLVRRNVTAVASSTAVHEHLRKWGFNDPLLWENVASTEAISNGALNQERQGNSAIFFGNLSGAKVDVELLSRIVASGVHLHIAGPIAEGGGDRRAFEALIAHPNVSYHGVLKPHDAAALMGKCCVGLVPYYENPYTRGVYPMKVYEYLAAGLPVVCSGVPSVTATDDVFVAKDQAAFVAYVKALAMCIDSANAVQRRTDTASRHSWTNRGNEAWQLVQSLLRPVHLV